MRLRWAAPREVHPTDACPRGALRFEDRLDWMTGEIKQRWQFPDDSRIWNAFGAITTILEDGDLLIGEPLPSSDGSIPSLENGGPLALLHPGDRRGQ